MSVEDRQPNHSHRRRRTLRIVGAGLTGSFVLATVAGCGRSAPVDALSGLDDDPDIAGVSVTSPDAVVATVATSEQPVVSTTEVVEQAQAVYTVQAGDTLSVIADQYDISTQALADYNAITDVNTIRPGQELLIPPQVVEVTVVDSTTTTAQP